MDAPRAPGTRDDGSQALLVVLGPIMVDVGVDRGVSVGAIGQARSVTAVVAIAVSASIANRVDTLGVSRLVAVGGGTVIAVAGYGTFGVVLAAVMSISALLILRVDDPA